MSSNVPSPQDLNDLGLRCPEDISVASTDTIPGIGGLRPRLTRTEHPVDEMTNEALRMLVDRINNGVELPPRKVMFQPAFVLGTAVALSWILRCRPDRQ